MSQIVTTPDGTEHEFPDETTDDVINSTLKSYMNSQSPPVVPVDPSNMPARPVTPTPNNSFIGRMLTNLGKIGQNADDDMRLFGRGWTQGLGDKYLGGPEAVQATDAASERQGWLGVVPETLGMMTNPISLASKGAKAGGMVGAAGEGALQSGTRSYSEGNSPQQVMIDAARGGVISAGLQPVASAITKGTSKLIKALPDWMTGADTPKVPTSADVTNPSKLGGHTFISNADKQSASVLDDLQEMRRRAAVRGGPSLQSQVASYLTNPKTVGELTRTQYNALDAVKPPPVSGFFAEKPWLAGHMIGDMPAILGVEQLMHGEPGQAAISTAIAAGSHLGGYVLPGMLARRGVKQTLDEASRVIGGTPSTPSPAAEALTSPGASEALRRLLFSLGQSTYQ